MDMQVPIAAVKSAVMLSPLLVVVGFVLLGGIIGMVLLLANPKTRAAGVVLLLIGLIGGGVIVSLAAVHWASSYNYEIGHETYRQEMEIAKEHERRLQAMQQAANNAAYEEMAIRQNALLASRGNKNPTPSKDDTADAKPDGTDSTVPVDVPSDDTAPETGTSPDEPVAEPRPEWVGAMSRTTNNGVLMMPITVGPYLRRIDCDKMLPGAILEAARTCGATIMGSKAIGRVSLPNDYPSERIIVDQWEETVETSFGPMVQLHVFLQFDKEVQRQIKQEVEAAYRRDTVTYRIWFSAVAMASAVALLGILFVGLKITRSGGGKQPPSNTDAEGEAKGTWT